VWLEDEKQKAADKYNTVNHASTDSIKELITLQ